MRRHEVPRRPRFRAPLFREDELAREREVVIGEYDRQESSPFFRFERADGQARSGAREWSRKNMIGDRDVIRSTHAREDARHPAPLLRAEQRGAHRHRRRAARHACSRWPQQHVRRLPARRRSVRRRSDPRRAAAHGERGGDRRGAGEHRAVLVQWQGPSVRQGSAGDVRRRRVLRRASTRTAPRFQRRLVDSGLWHSVLRELLHAQPHRADHDQRRDDADKLRAALAALDAEIAKFDQPGYFTAAERRAAEAAAHR